jgi:hypothetical protein
MEFTLNLNNPTTPATALTSGGVVHGTVLNTIGDFSGTITGRLSPAKLGNSGFVTASGAYLTNLERWKLSMRCPALPATAMTGSAVTDRSFVPGIITSTGSWTAAIDDTTPLVKPGVSYSATLKLLENDANDQTLAATIYTTGAPFTVKVGEVSLVEVPFAVSGDITAAGTGGSGGIPSPLFAAGVIQRPAVGELILQAHAGRTYTGNAFWTSIDIDVPVDDLITVTVNFQGSGALTIA